MGGVVPKGENNEELIDNLVETEFIVNPAVEKVFRLVDRGDFYPGEYLEDAYKDLAMKNKNIHISAPCIYCKVVENLELEQGLSFLNIGFGTGFLSTLVGLMIGFNGTNHGIDIYQDVLEYASQRVEEFELYSESFDHINFCKPNFKLVNIECLDFSFHNYDRVYCGARVPNEEMRRKIKKLIKIENGILIYPYGESLLKYKRTSPTTSEETSLLAVQFSDLITNQLNVMTGDVKIYLQPKTLQSLCRNRILTLITKDSLGTLDELPIPKTLIRFLKYYRDPAVKKPIRERKVRAKLEGELNFEIVAI